MIRIAVEAKFNKFSFGLSIIVRRIIIRIFRAAEFIAAFLQQ